LNFYNFAPNPKILNHKPPKQSIEAGIAGAQQMLADLDKQIPVEKTWTQ